VIKLLNGDDRESLRGIYEHEFDSEVPSDDQANVVAVIEDDELQAFMTSEVLIRCDQWWVSPPYRNTSKAAALIRQLARYLFKNVPKDSSVIIFAANDNQGRLFTKLGFREVENVRVYRLDR
jgi:predicted GNAT family acetyltransferase